MSISDPLADLITRIRNGQTAEKSEIRIPSSKLKVAVCSVLREEGYIGDIHVQAVGDNPELIVSLKYHQGRPVISDISRISRPGRREYRGYKNLPLVLGGFGEAVISTPKGVMSASRARALQLGGEVLCVVS